MTTCRRAAWGAAIAAAALSMPAAADNILLNVPVDVRVLNPRAQRIYLACQAASQPFAAPVHNDSNDSYDLPAVPYVVRPLNAGRFEGTVQYAVTTQVNYESDIYYRCWIYVGLDDGEGHMPWTRYQSQTRETLNTVHWWTTGRVPRGGAAGALTGGPPPRPGVTQPTVTRVTPRARPN